MKIDRWDFLGLLCVLFLIGSGIHGVANRRRVNNLGNLIISVGQIVLGLFGLLMIILFVIKGAR